MKGHYEGGKDFICGLPEWVRSQRIFSKLNELRKCALTSDSLRIYFPNDVCFISPPPKGGQGILVEILPGYPLTPWESDFFYE